MTGKTFEELRDYILLWARDRELLEEEYADKQFTRIVEKIFELRDEYTILQDRMTWLEEDYGEEINENTKCSVRLQKKTMMRKLGNVLINLIILCEQLNHDDLGEDSTPTKCLEMEYENEIFKVEEYYHKFL